MNVPVVMCEELDACIVRVENLTVRFPGRSKPIFESVEFTVPRGSIFGIFGETGCGKTTLGQCLVGFIPFPYIQGRISLSFQDGQKIVHFSEAPWKQVRGKKVVYVPQDPYKTLNPFETVGCQIRRILNKYNKNVALNTILQKICLDEDALELYPRSLSAGQRQKSILACALAASPELFILDEPIASIDSESRRTILETFLQLSKEGHTLIIICHEIPEYRSFIPSHLCFDFSPERKVYDPAVRACSDSDSISFIHLQKVKKNFDGFPVLQNINMEVGLNRWIYLEGSNGCGKSTLLHILLGFIPPDGGNLYWLKQKICWSRLYEHAAIHIHAVYQDIYHSFNPRMSIQESLEEVILAAPSWERPRMENMKNSIWTQLELSGELLSLLPSQLSYGQQKRVALVRTLLKYRLMTILHPGSLHLFLFDEIFSGIHTALRSVIISLLEDMRKERIFSIIWVAHGQEELKSLCDFSYRMEQGQLILDGNFQHLGKERSLLEPDKVCN